ncbi:DUF3404 domain-containing protein [Photobacterium sp. CAU 1568]|uniref:histidine kinase n=1 Tax=Photobacterium arenosum TaxID=2774143 RepID=A0ABR9BGU4_9GAMM|nr:DUF3404 domain-containing protein [Photobacterium arenosum]MBD8511399.1 DUF3404 domain-containing protein [Photobacterium arenosum]
MVRNALLPLLLVALPVCGQPETHLAHQQWQAFSDRIATVQGEDQISQQSLNQYPQELLLPVSQYPDLKRFSWAQIETLYHIHTHCSEDDNVLSDSADWRRAVQFELILCREGKLPSQWSQHLSERHPAGGSYADRYVNYLRDHHDGSDANAFLQQHANSLTLAHPLHPLHGIFASLSDTGQSAILGGSRYFLTKSGRLWRNTLTGIDVLSPEQWQPIADKAGIRITRSSDQVSESCRFQYSNLCIELRRTNALWWQGGMLILLVIILGLIFRLGLERRREMKERQFILQLLTHELRTPITSLGFTVEQFRDEYDHLNEQSQHAFYRLLGDYQRLYRLTETSKGFLSGRREEGLDKQDAQFSEWLESIASQYDLHCHIDGDRRVSLPYYWLGVCLDNLLRNAVLHGKQPIYLDAQISDSLVIEVRDQGTSPARWEKWLLTEKGDGMGIGLMIVNRIMRRIGGRMTHLRHPTRYILELPL